MAGQAGPARAQITTGVLFPPFPVFFYELRYSALLGLPFLKPLLFLCNLVVDPFSFLVALFP